LLSAGEVQVAHFTAGQTVAVDQPAHGFGGTCVVVDADDEIRFVDPTGFRRKHVAQVDRGRVTAAFEYAQAQIEAIG